MYGTFYEKLSHIFEFNSLKCSVYHIYHIYHFFITKQGHAVAQLVEALRYMGSIPDGVIGIFH